MALNGHQQKKRQRAKLYQRQGGRCYWCNRPMSWPIKPKHGAQHPDSELTIDHLDDRWSDDRGSRSNEYRRVAACRKCNQERSNANQAAQPIEELHRRSGRVGNRP